jgi:hypothetical protein
MTVQQLTGPDIIQTTINELLKGRANNVGSVTLGAGVTASSVVDTRITLSCKVFLSPRTANAAAAIPTTWISAVIDGGFTLTHANAGTIDRTFDYIFHA